MLRIPLAAALALAPLVAQQSVPFGEILPGVVCEGQFVADRDGLQGVAVPIATYARRNTSTLVAELFVGDERLAQQRWAADALVDNAAIELPCPVQAKSRDVRYRLVLRSPDAAPGNAVTAWRDPGTGIRLQPAFVGDTLMLGELVAGVRVAQSFVAAADGLCSVQVLLTNYGRSNRGTVELSIHDAVAGRRLAVRQVDAATIGNEDWRTLEFAPVADSAGGTFTVRLESLDGQPGSGVTAYLDRGASYRGELTWNGVPRLGRLMLTAGHGDPGFAWVGTLAWSVGGVGLLLLGLAAWAHRRRRPVRRLLCGAATMAGVVLAGIGYRDDLGLLFWSAGFAACIAALAVAATARRARRFVVQVAMVPLLLLFALLIAEPFGAADPASAGARTATPKADLDLREAPWSFERTGGDPAAFQRWWQRLTGEWSAPGRGGTLVQRPDPLGELPFVLTPGVTTRCFESAIRINDLGFRGPDVARSKGDAFRIVCIGESTTMGQTLFAEDRPWPEVLQELVNTPARSRRIEVVNAGWASYDVRHSAIRLRRFVLDLQPDLLIVYHGYNGFWMLLPDVSEASIAARQIPRLVPRPSWVLAQAEYGFRLARVSAARQSVAQEKAGAGAGGACAAAYEEILRLCAERGIHVALCSFNMAVRADSPPEVVAFYRAGFPQVERQIAANELHTRLLRGLAEGRDRVTFVDTSDGLDGAWAEHFIDLVHFTQAGRQRLARAVAEGIARLLPD